jgi:hypothetical protein
MKYQGKISSNQVMKDKVWCSLSLSERPMSASEDNFLDRVCQEAFEMFVSGKMAPKDMGPWALNQFRKERGKP